MKLKTRIYFRILVLLLLLLGALYGVALSFWWNMSAAYKQGELANNIIMHSVAMSDEIHYNDLVKIKTRLDDLLLGGYGFDYAFVEVVGIPLVSTLPGGVPRALIENANNKKNGFFEYQNSKGETILHVHSSVKNTKAKLHAGIKTTFIHTSLKGMMIYHVLILSFFCLLAVILSGLATNIIVRETEVLQAQLVQSGKLAALGTMSAGIAHELNNPLTIIKGFTEISLSVLKKDGIHHPKLESSLLKIDHATERMTVIVNHVRASSRDPDKEERKEVHPHEIVTNSLVLLQAQLKSRNIHLELSLPRDLPGFWINTIQMESVLQNLLANARDSFDGYEPPGEKKIHVTASADDLKKLIVFVVRDNGKGIVTDDLKRIYDPFFTTKETGKGTGLGLSVVYNIIREHGGDIDVKSHENQGTTFTVRIPMDIRMRRMKSERA